MRDGYLKVSAATPTVRVADVNYNVEQIISLIDESRKNKVKVLVFPELCITGYTCGDLFLQDSLIAGAMDGLMLIVEATKGSDEIVVVGLPIVQGYKLFNCAAILQNGQVLGFVPKTYIPNHSEAYETRHFTSGMHATNSFVEVQGEEVPFGVNLLFQCKEFPSFILGCEICEDLWAPISPSTKLALAGATVICNPSASVEMTAKDNYRKQLVMNQSAKLVCGYIYADCGIGESTTDVVYSGHNMIVEDGTMLAQAKRFTNETIVSELDLSRLQSERRRMSTFHKIEENAYYFVPFHMDMEETELTRQYNPHPFIPEDPAERKDRCDEILMLQAMGLRKRLEHTGCNYGVIGISGGLDSTLAVLVTAKAFDMLQIPRKNMICITMPCFGTTDRRYQNAIQLTKCLGGTLKEIPIQKAVEQHFMDIDHNIENHDVTFENSQARERTQVLMDVANEYNGMVIGTGDMSELALGWATYNGDHMSMYAVNCSVPKTLVRHIVQYYADTCQNKELEKVLFDILDTPVSPELLPPVDGTISQKTEDLVGPYELHDFYLYYMLRYGFSPKKILRLATVAFSGMYSQSEIYKWMRVFYWRFFSQQFKRSCVPDGPKVGSVALSPRGDLKMPSDASVALWMKELDSSL